MALCRSRTSNRSLLKALAMPGSICHRRHVGWQDDWRTHSHELFLRRVSSASCILTPLRAKSVARRDGRSSRSRSTGGPRGNVALRRRRGWTRTLGAVQRVIASYHYCDRTMCWSSSCGVEPPEGCRITWDLLIVTSANNLIRRRLRGQRPLRMLREMPAVRAPALSQCHTHNGHTRCVSGPARNPRPVRSADCRAQAAERTRSTKLCCAEARITRARPRRASATVCRRRRLSEPVFFRGRAEWSIRRVSQGHSRAGCRRRGPRRRAGTFPSRYSQAPSDCPTASPSHGGVARKASAMHDGHRGGRRICPARVRAGDCDDPETQAREALPPALSGPGSSPWQAS